MRSCPLILLGCACQVWLFLNGIPEFSKDTAEGRKQKQEYDRFLTEAAAGINEKVLIVRKTN